MREISKWWIVPLCLLIIGLTLIISSNNIKNAKLDLSMDNNTLEAFNRAVSLQNISQTKCEPQIINQTVFVDRNITTYLNNQLIGNVFQGYRVIEEEVHYLCLNEVYQQNTTYVEITGANQYANTIIFSVNGVQKSIPVGESDFINGKLIHVVEGMIIDVPYLGACAYITVN